MIKRLVCRVNAYVEVVERSVTLRSKKRIPYHWCPGKTSALNGKSCHVWTSGDQAIEGLVFVRTGNTGCDTLRGRVSGDERMLQATTPLGSEPAPVQGFDPSGVVAYRTMRPRAASTPKGVAAGVGIFPGHQWIPYHGCASMPPSPKITRSPRSNAISISGRLRMKRGMSTRFLMFPVVTKTSCLGML